MSFQIRSSNMSGGSIPVFVVFQQRDENNDNDDDDASMVSFSTCSMYSQRSDLSSSCHATTCTSAEQDSRWDPLEIARSASGRALAQLQKQKSQSRRRRSSIEESPHHPERSLSFSSSNNNNNGNNNSPTKFNHGTQLPRGGTTHRVSPPKRATRLSRMAERAKAVRARTPVGARKKSFHQMRRSLPETHHSHSSHQAVRLPVRTKSINGASTRRSSLPALSKATTPRSSCIHRNSSTPRGFGCNTMDCSCSSSTPSSSSNNINMIPVRRRNSFQCILPSAQEPQSRRGSVHGTGGGVLCPTRSTGRGLEAMILRQRALSHAQMTMIHAAQQCGASVQAAGPTHMATSNNQAPRLPQRFPSEATPKPLEQHS